MKPISLLREFTCQWDHTVLPATRQSRPPRHNPSWRWYSIHLPVKDERLSWPENRSQIKVHTDERTQVLGVRSSLMVTHPSTGRGRRALISVNESPSKQRSPDSVKQAQASLYNKVQSSGVRFCESVTRSIGHIIRGNVSISMHMHLRQSRTSFFPHCRMSPGLKST